MQGQAVGMFEPERYGVPSFYELVLIANDSSLAQRREILTRFVGAIARGLGLTVGNPQEAFKQYVALNPTLNDAFNRRSLDATLPAFARSQRQQRERWAAFNAWMAARHVIPTPVPVDQLYTNLVPQP
jgi:putative hydroxymethylpyrimidine transport system substrate-binding protein